MKSEKSYWLSFDLGVEGDYTGLYQWLDNHNAKPCGNNVAFFKYPVDVEDTDAKLKKDIEEHVKLKPRNKLYIIRVNEENQIEGTFIFGKRGYSPWEGYGSDKENQTDDY